MVNEQHGAEEYVHLKSLEDEIHFMDSTMPPKEHEQQDSDHPSEPPQSSQHHEGDEGDELPPVDGEVGNHPSNDDSERNMHERPADDRHVHSESELEQHQQENRPPKKNRDYLFEPSPSLDETQEEEAIPEPNISKSLEGMGIFYETQRFLPSDLQPPQPSSKAMSRRNSQESLHDIDE